MHYHFWALNEQKSWCIRTFELSMSQNADTFALFITRRAKTLIHSLDPGLAEPKRWYIRLFEARAPQIGPVPRRPRPTHIHAHYKFSENPSKQSLVREQPKVFQCFSYVFIVFSQSFVVFHCLSSCIRQKSIIRQKSMIFIVFCSLTKLCL